MKNLVLSILSISAILPVFACDGGAGDKEYANTTLSCISNAGDVDLTNSSVTNKTSVTGDLKSTNSQLNNVDVTGKFTASNSKMNAVNVTGEINILNGSIVSGPTKITGQFFASDSTFLAPIHFISGTIQFKNTKAQNLFINSHNDDNKKTKVFISGGEISGNITFNYDNGEVYVSNGAKISGNVIGGVVIQN